MDPSNHLQMALMSKRLDRSKALLSLEQEVERQTTEVQIAENEGHEKFKESQRIEPAAKVQGGKGAANNIVDSKELKEYNVLISDNDTHYNCHLRSSLPSARWIRRQWEGNFS